MCVRMFVRVFVHAHKHVRACACGLVCMCSLPCAQVSVCLHAHVGMHAWRHCLKHGLRHGPGHGIYTWPYAWARRAKGSPFPKRPRMDLDMDGCDVALCHVASSSRKQGRSKGSDQEGCGSKRKQPDSIQGGEQRQLRQGGRRGPSAKAKTTNKSPKTKAFKNSNNSNSSTSLATSSSRSGGIADKGQRIRLGTDFSGLETPSLAAARCGIKMKLVFATEKEPKLLEFIKAKYNPNVTYDDIDRRALSDVPAVDLYIAGASCQPWSNAGSGHGLSDASGRGKHLRKAVNYIVKHRPHAFILENVGALVSSPHRKEFEFVLNKLTKNGFTVNHCLMSTHEHGVPQHRPRIYICGFDGEPKHPFNFPDPLKHCLLMEDILDDKPSTLIGPASSSTAQKNIDWVKAAVQREGINLDKSWVIVDIDASRRFKQFMINKSPCITKSRGRSGYYILNKERRMSLHEIARLQGFRPSDIEPLAKHGKTFLGAAIGNAMSVNVLERLLPRVCYSAGLIRSADLMDGWESKAYRPI